MTLREALDQSNCGVAQRVTKQKSLAIVRRFDNGKVRWIVSLNDPRHYQHLPGSHYQLTTWEPVNLQPGQTLPPLPPIGPPRKNGGTA